LELLCGQISLLHYYMYYSSYFRLVLREHRVYVVHSKIEFRSFGRGRQWCGIFHYYWWTALIKPRLLFSMQAVLPEGFPFPQLDKKVMFILILNLIKHEHSHSKKVSQPCCMSLSLIDEVDHTNQLSLVCRLIPIVALWRHWRFYWWWNPQILVIFASTCRIEETSYLFFKRLFDSHNCLKCHIIWCFVHKWK